MREICGGDQIRRRGSGVGVFCCGKVVEPIAELKAAGPDVRFAGARAFVLDPSPHALVLRLQHVGIGVSEIEIPGDDRRRVSPTSRTRRRLIPEADEHIRHDPGHRAVLTLIGGKIRKPLREESIHIHVEGGRGREQLRITGPTQALVPLRTVGGHVDKVSFLAPQNIVLQLIDGGI